MIRINLLKDIGGSAGAVGVVDMGDEEAGASNRDAYKKLVILCFPVLFAYGFEFYLDNEKQTEISFLQKKLNSMKTEVKNLQPQIKAVNRFKEEKQKLEVQVEAIKQLSKERLINVKALDTLQAVIPKEVWLESLKVDDERVTIKGKTVSDSFITSFLQSLNQSIYFTDVQLIGTSEQSGKNGPVKLFEFSARLAMGK